MKEPLRSEEASPRRISFLFPRLFPDPSRTFHGFRKICPSRTARPLPPARLSMTELLSRSVRPPRTVRSPGMIRPPRTARPHGMIRPLRTVQSRGITRIFRTAQAPWMACFFRTAQALLTAGPYRRIRSPGAVRLLRMVFLFRTVCPRPPYPVRILPPPFREDRPGGRGSAVPVLPAARMPTAARSRRAPHTAPRTGTHTETRTGPDRCGRALMRPPGRAFPESS